MEAVGVAAYKEYSQKSCTLFVGCPAFFHTYIRSPLIQPSPYNTFRLPPCPNFAYTIVFNFSWKMKSSLKHLWKIVMQNLLGANGVCGYVFWQLAIRRSFCDPRLISVYRQGDFSILRSNSNCLKKRFFGH